MQRESESEESVLWNEIGEVLDTEMSTVEDIRADLARNDKGNTCQTINNCMLVFQRDPVLKGAIRKNELSGKIDIVGNLGWQRTSSSLTDTDVYQIHWYLEKNYGLKNDRNINKMIVNQVLPTCQLQMGMTELKPGSVWNTMPAHVHSRRMEAYFYFEVPDEHAVCHFMGEVDETRHIWMKGDQAVLSPEWSIHSAAATHNYTFIWGMGGENLDYGDQDFSLISDLK